MSVSETITLAIAIIGAITGVIGTGLGVWSIRRQIDDDRVKLRVGAYWAITTALNEPPFLSISVTNMSKFPITLRETGLLIGEGRQRAIHRDAVRQIPIRMEPRTSVSVNYPPDFITEAQNKSAYCAYASTDCGELVQSAPNIIPQMFEEAAKRLRL